MRCFRSEKLSCLSRKSSLSSCAEDHKSGSSTTRKNCAKGAPSLKPITVHFGLTLHTQENLKKRDKQFSQVVRNRRSGDTLAWNLKLNTHAPMLHRADLKMRGSNHSFVI